MAPSKKGAPASASKPVRLGKKSGRPVVRVDGGPTKAEKKIANKANHKKLTSEVQDSVRNLQKMPPPIVMPEDGVRPTEYTEALGAVLFELWSTGFSLDNISKRPDMPRLGLLLRWINDDKHPCARLYTRAKSMLVPLFEERVLQVALEPQRSMIKTCKQHVTKDGDVVDIVERKYTDNVDRSRLAAAAYQWTLGHMLPRKHGRNPSPDGEKANEQLEALFAALKAGPTE